MSRFENQQRYFRASDAGKAFINRKVVEATTPVDDVPAQVVDDAPVTPVEDVGKAVVTPEQEYDTAQQTFREAYKAFEQISDDFQAGKIGDDEYLAGKETYTNALDDVDRAEIKFKEITNGTSPEDVGNQVAPTPVTALPVEPPATIDDVDVAEPVIATSSPSQVVGGAPPPTRQKAIAKQFKKSLPGYKDLTGMQTWDTAYIDPLRAAKHMEQSETGGAFRQYAMEPVFAADAIKTKEHQRIVKRLHDFMVRTDIKPNSESSRRVFQFIDEGRPASVNLTAGEREFVEIIDDIYADLGSRINATRRSMGIPEMNIRPDYITHAWKEGFIQQVFGDNPPMEAMKAIMGTAKARAPWFGFSLQRKGATGFADDAFYAISRYLDPALAQIYMPVPVQNARRYVALLPDNAKAYFTKWLDSGALGRATGIDKAVYATPVARGASVVSNAVTDRVASALIEGNINTALMQLSSFPQQIGDAGFKTTVRGLGKLLGGKVGHSGAAQAQAQVQGLNSLAWSMSDSGWEFAKKNSRTLADRQALRYEDVLSTSGDMTVGKYRAALSWALQTGDQLSVAWSFNTGYLKAQKLGLVGDDAIRYADDFATRMQGSFNKLYKPPILRNRTLKPLTSLQNYPINLFMYFKNDIALGPGKTTWDKTKATAKVIAAMYGINRVYEMIGLNAPFESFMSLVPFNSYMRVGLQTGGVEQFFGADEATVGRAASPAPITIAVAGGSAIDKLINKTDMTANERREQWRRLFTAAMRSGVPAGNQIQKTTLGAIDAANETAPSRGKNIPMQDPVSKIQSIMFGSHKSRAVSEYNERREKPGKVDKLIGLLRGGSSGERPVLKINTAKLNGIKTKTKTLKLNMKKLMPK